MNDEERISNRLKRDPKTKIIYNELLKSAGPLSKKNNKHSKDIFLLAFALGYKNNNSLPLESNEEFINDTNFGKVLPFLIDAVAINKSEKGINILTDKSPKKYKYAEEYANAGINLLESKYGSNKDKFIEDLRSEIFDVYNNKILEKLKELNID